MKKNGYFNNLCLEEYLLFTNKAERLCPNPGARLRIYRDDLGHFSISSCSGLYSPLQPII